MPSHQPAQCQCCLPRRALFGGLAAATLAARRARADVSGRAYTGTRLTPAGAIAELVNGNERYRNNTPRVCTANLAALRQATSDAQTPFAGILSCADSRVPPDLVFDQTLGDLFVTRVAGNIVSADVIASLEYGAAALGTRAIMVLAHEKCGAVKAAIEGKQQPGQITTLYTALQPAIERGRHDLTAAIQANARIQADLLRKSSPVLADLIRQNKLTIVAAYYELVSGRVTIL
jgi:carbonic anhydrase